MAVTEINYIDNSEINADQLTPEVDTNSPLWLVCSTFNKGPEDLREVYGDEFYDLYGKTVDFDKHGEAVLQAKQIIDNGGRLLVQRLVADDATLANLVLSASVESAQKQKFNDIGQLIYLNDQGEETTEAVDSTTGNENEPVMLTIGKITWTASSISGARSFDEVYNSALRGATADTRPIYIFTDIGRSEVKKAVRITPDYNVSSGVGSMFYASRVYEGVEEIEASTVTADPGVIYGNQSYRIEGSTYDQLVGDTFGDNYTWLVNQILDIINDGVEEENKVAESVIRSHDLLFGYTIDGDESSYISVDGSSVGLDASYGVELDGGSYGSFGETPIDDDHVGLVNEKILAFYKGEITDLIYDTDNYQLFAIADAGYTQEIKDAIATYVTFRNDCVFLRFLGMNLTSFLQIKGAKRAQTINNFRIADYATSYMVRDPETLRTINVSMLYDFVGILTANYIASPFNPTAGVANGYILESALPGTISYTPIRMPGVNYKKAIKDLKVNYAVMENGQCVVQSLFTANNIYSQLSYLSNVISMQFIGRQIAEVCPQCRFILSPGVADFEEYNTQINRVLEQYAGSFQTLELVYTTNPMYAIQKVYYAAINFNFGNWAEDEVFDLVANPMNITVTEEDLEEE